MRKAFTAGTGLPADGLWMDVEAVARVELTSEAAGHPFEAALTGAAGGWRAGTPGIQRIRLVFDAPRHIERVRLGFEERVVERTQQFHLRYWAASQDVPREVVRQQYTFSPAGSVQEVEEYAVDLVEVVALEIEIVPDVRGGGTATLSRLQLAGR